MSNPEKRERGEDSERGEDVDYQTEDELVNNPSHYTQGKIEVIEFIEDQAHLGFRRLTALKYICRSGKKDGESPRKDLKKAIWYLQREIDKNEEMSKV